MNTPAILPFDDRTLIQNYVDEEPPGDGSIGGIIVPEEFAKKEQAKAAGFYRIATVITPGAELAAETRAGRPDYLPQNNVEIVEVGDLRFEMIRDSQVVAMLVAGSMARGSAH